MEPRRAPSNVVRIGCAGWSLRKEYSEHFLGDGTHLARYATRFTAVEINSSFYRPHRQATYARWAQSVPENFRFSLKIPKLATHQRRLVDVDDVLDGLIAAASGLGNCLGPLLVQLPPSLSFDDRVAENFFTALRDRFDGDVVFEPRHPSWFEEPVNRMLVQYRIARVAADPAVVPSAAEPAGWDRLVYYRLHGAPKIYYSSYDAEYLESLAAKLEGAARTSAVWCIFDNTALGAATANALDVLARL